MPETAIVPIVGLTTRIRCSRVALPPKASSGETTGGSFITLSGITRQLVTLWIELNLHGCSMRGTLLAATALGFALAACVGTPQAQAQFVCIGNADGAAVGNGLAGTSASGQGATAAGSPNNVACGPNANASGASSSHRKGAWLKAALSFGGPPVGGLFDFIFSSRPHPRKFCLKRFWC